MTTTSDQVHRQLLEHIGGSWPDREQVDLEWEMGPIKERLPSFQVRRLSPPGPGFGYVYLSVGAFEAPSAPPYEFFLMAPAESWSHVETLAMVAHFHSFPEHSLRPGSLVDLGKPWTEGSKFHHLLVSWPHPFDPRVATCDTARGEVMFLWLVAISEQEAQFSRTYGVELLEDRLEASGVNLLDPFRGSVI
ncbi:suppressor of fused domain protein [Micromonospora sp. NPDC050276]|uniref:suppressor of fused domain protein n=1 Tax=Micromonospora sp. NPDC050276 TaxID=3364278 RepID=UPI0037BB2EA1